MYVSINVLAYALLRIYVHMYLYSYTHVRHAQTYINMYTTATKVCMYYLTVTCWNRVYSIPPTWYNLCVLTNLFPSLGIRHPHPCNCLLHTPLVRDVSLLAFGTGLMGS